jgi:hypothetical protein
VEREVSKEVGEQIIVLVLRGLPPQPSVVDIKGLEQGAGLSATNTNVEARGPSLSLREFLNETRAKTNTEKITAIGAYLHQHRDRRVFSARDMSEGFRAAAEPVPGNVNRDLRTTRRFGWIAEDPSEPHNFYVTREGFSMVERRFLQENGTSSRK